MLITDIFGLKLHMAQYLPLQVDPVIPSQAVYRRNALFGGTRNGMLDLDHCNWQLLNF